MDQNRYASLRQAQSSVSPGASARIRVQRAGTPPAQASARRPPWWDREGPQHGNRKGRGDARGLAGDMEDDDLPWRMQELRLTGPGSSPQQRFAHHPQSHHQHNHQHNHNQLHQHHQQQQQQSPQQRWSHQSQSQQQQLQTPPHWQNDWAQNQHQHQQYQQQHQQHSQRSLLPPQGSNSGHREVEQLAQLMQDGVSMGLTPQQQRQQMIHNEQMEEISCRFENVRLERDRFMPYIL